MSAAAARAAGSPAPVDEPVAGLGARHPDVRRLRALLRERGARDEEERFVLEGPRVIAGALDAGATIDELLLGFGARGAFGDLVARVQALGTPVRSLREGVLEKVGTTRTPQPVLAVAPTVDRPVGEVAQAHGGAGGEAGPATLLVLIGVADPGNLGTLVRAAAAAGCAGVVVCGGADVHNPRAVRASAGALFAVPIAQTPEADAALVLDQLAAHAWRRVAARADAPRSLDDVELGARVAVVLGNETRGLGPELAGHLDDAVRIPMAGSTESLNVAMAGTVLCFEAARRRRGGIGTVGADR